MALRDVLKPINISSNMNNYIKRYRLKEKDGEYKIEFHTLWGYGPWICFYIYAYGKNYEGKMELFSWSQRYENKNSAILAIKKRIILLSTLKYKKNNIVEFDINDIA